MAGYDDIGDELAGGCDDGDAALTVSEVDGRV